MISEELAFLNKQIIYGIENKIYMRWMKTSLVRQHCCTHMFVLRLILGCVHHASRHVEYELRAAK